MEIKIHPKNELDENSQDIERKVSMKPLLLLIIAIVVVLVALLIGVKIMTPPTMDDLIQDIIEQGSTEHGYIYNGFVFVNYQNLWHTQLQRGDNLYNLHFHNSPAEVDTVPVIGDLNSDLDTSKFYITFDPLEENVSVIGVAMAELGLSLVKAMSVEITPACYINETDGCATRPIITCNNTEEAVMFVRSAPDTKVIIEDNCITMQGPGEDVYKAIDKVLFDLYGIIENQ